MFKNQLQELAQRSCFNLPSYACIREGPDHAPRFKATVNFNGETFESPAFCTTLRQAEHSAAEVALTELSKRGPSRSLAARVLDETGVYKNLLQETAHRAGLNLPVYTTVRSGPGHVPVFHCTVELAGLSFTGEPAKTKKQAQKNAAMAAWSVLKQLPHMQSSSSSSTKLEPERKDEQEQIVVARALAKLCPSDVKRSVSQTDRHHGQQSVPTRPEMKPTSNAMHLYPMQYPPPSPSWSYPHYSPEIPMFRMWQPEPAFPPQNCLLTLPVAPSPLPLVHSIFQPDHGLKPVTVTPGIPGPSHNLYTNRAMPVHVRSRSQVTIQEIQEEKDRPKEEESWLRGGGGGGGGGANSEVQNPTISEPLQEKTHDNPSTPVRIRTVGPRPEFLKAWVPAPAPVPTPARPRPMYTGRMPSRNFMAPAVQIRSIIPVCSAPPVKLPESGKEGGERTKEAEDVAAVKSELGKLQI